MPKAKAGPRGRPFQPKLKTHDENLKIICLFCGRKGDQLINQHYQDTFCKVIYIRFAITTPIMSSN